MQLTNPFECTHIVDVPVIIYKIVCSHVLESVNRVKIEAMWVGQGEGEG